MGFFACSVRTGKNCSAGGGGGRKTGGACGRAEKPEGMEGWSGRAGWLGECPGESGRKVPEGLKGRKTRKGRGRISESLGSSRGRRAGSCGRPWSLGRHGWLGECPGESGRDGGQTGPEACRGNGERVEYCGTPRELGKPEGWRQRPGRFGWAGKSGKNDPEGRRAAGRAAEAGSFPDAGLETGAGNGSGAGQRTGLTLRSFFVFLSRAYGCRIELVRLKRRQVLPFAVWDARVVVAAKAGCTTRQDVPSLSRVWCAPHA